jgi:hypothetical protein
MQEVGGSIPPGSTMARLTQPRKERTRARQAHSEKTCQRDEHVDIIRSVTFPIQEYVGRDLEQRLADHNDGKSTHTAKYKPWRFGPWRFGPWRFGPRRFGPRRFGPRRFGLRRFGLGAFPDEEL